jgi:hypothetical protein
MEKTRTRTSASMLQWSIQACRLSIVVCKSPAHLPSRRPLPRDLGKHYSSLSPYDIFFLLLRGPHVSKRLSTPLVVLISYVTSNDKRSCHYHWHRSLAVAVTVVPSSERPGTPKRAQREFRSRNEQFVTHMTPWVSITSHKCSVLAYSRCPILR